MDICIHYANSNIAPRSEYEHRRDTAREYAESQHVRFEEGSYRPEEWAQAMKALPEDARTSPDGQTPPPERCRACYALRFAESAEFATSHGFTHMGTTLTVSPYQYAAIIKEELERACADAGIQPFYEDYSPLYQETVRASKEAGLYRQDYCGCLPSKAEADAGRAARKAKRDEERAKRAKAREQEERSQAARKAERAEYDAERAKRRAILKRLREEEQQANRSTDADE